MKRTWRVELGRESGAQAAEWQVIIDACPWAEVEDTDGDGVPDRFVYVIVVESGGIRPGVIEAGGQTALRATLPEKSVVGPWRQLVERVQTADRRDT